ncbi:hypothetical protein DOTSEDRAFT_74702 [Dothistroma septosporum NZE10]|uniref:Uncharacterized protein n=1 Tax=Dothistroma septosporum (strain NZE10 / CBS 128990) TaxID=675120 RepID=N1PC08_DOTSN|nr:hypothetical protein DOTSEDRAFT_74702 [Dothistroma septosporum NZE10]
MPPVRTMPVTRPVRTERTHEENQERAYIAASRRSDRSLEARVESARRASEIHKKRTGRSLRVREEDVMNEEMYEEEDDDLPMQFRRINALNPGFAFNNFNDRVNSYLAGQIGVRNYLHQAIYQANQANQMNQQFYNPMMQQGFNGTMSPQAMSGPFNGMQQSPFQQTSSMQNMRPASHGRSASIATPQEFAHYQQPQAAKATTPVSTDGRRVSVHSAGAPSPSASHAKSTAGSQPPTPSADLQKSTSAKRAPTPPHTAAHLPQGLRPSAASPASGSTSFEQSMYPLTTKLPLETQQLMDVPQFAGYASHMAPGMAPGSYSYNPNGKKRDSSHNSPSGIHGLDQTLTQFPMGSQGAMSNTTHAEPQSALSAPANLDFGFGSDMYGDMSHFNDSTYAFDLGFGSGSNTSHNSGHVTPATEQNWNESDFFNYAAASD